MIVLRDVLIPIIMFFKWLSWLQYRFGDKDYLGFEHFTLVPFESNLIDYILLTTAQVTMTQLEWMKSNPFSAATVLESNFRDVKFCLKRSSRWNNTMTVDY